MGVGPGTGPERARSCTHMREFGRAGQGSVGGGRACRLPRGTPIAVSSPSIAVVGGEVEGWRRGVGGGRGGGTMAAMPRTSETAFNPELAIALRGKHPRWAEDDRIGAEQSGVIQDHPGQRPDIVIHHPGGAPVIIETEFEPAPTVEADARARLGKIIAATGDEVEQAIAVRVPAELRSDQGGWRSRSPERSSSTASSARPRTNRGAGRSRAGSAAASTIWRG